MLVKVDHLALVAASSAAVSLANDIDAAVTTARTASPVDLPSLTSVPAKAQWVRDQVPMLDELAALALLLDTDGDGSATVDVPKGQWEPAALLEQAADDRFGPGFVDATGLEGAELVALLATLGSVGRDLPPDSGVMTPTELRQFIIDHPAVAGALRDLTPRGQGPAGELWTLSLPFSLSADGVVWPGQEQRSLDVRALFEGLSPADAAILAMTYPSVVGNLSGVPFANRAHANTVNVVATLADERAQLREVQKWLDENDQFDFEESIGKVDDRIALYESILAGNRQILHFDPAGDGQIVELHGPVGPGTDNVGVLVPGTGSDLSNFENTVTRSLSFQNENRDGQLVMISWLGTDMPDSVLWNATSTGYSAEGGPRLAEFSRDLQLEIEHSGSPDARVTVAGHSYGGATVGRSELHGLEADRVLHIASAGAGHEVDGPGDLPTSQREVDRYSLTAPGDPIEIAQGVGHGADPDTFEGTTRLHSGDKVDGSLNAGSGAHTSVFEEYSDAWRSMYEVFVGGTVETYRSPKYVETSSRTGNLVVRKHVGWNDDGSKVDIE